MVVKQFKELYCVDTISQDKGWKKIQEALGELHEDIVIDFHNINVIDPWQCPEFKKLLRNKHVFMRFINSESIVNRIKMMCIIDGLDESRIENIQKTVVKEKSPEEKRAEAKGNDIITFFEIENGVATLELKKKFTQLYSTNTIEYLDYAIKKIHNDSKIDKFILDVSGIAVLDNVLQALAKMMVEYYNSGFKMFVKSDMQEIMDKMGLFIHKETTKKYTVAEKKDIIVSLLKKDTAGMLMKYKKSKALDDFGREGKGEVISSRVAIFRGLDKNKKGEIVAKIETFNNDYFYTIAHWMIEHDYEEPTSLHSDMLEIPLDELGICDSFLGSKYHFILPIQNDSSENQIVIKKIDENGKNIKETCTIPRRMQIVFDSWEVKYNKEALEKAIKETDEWLATKDKKLANRMEGIDTP